MAKRDIIVIGGSAGAVDALMRFARALPPRLPASLFVVVHFPEEHDTALPQILSRSGPLPAQLAEDGVPYEPGRIYVARPGMHLMVEGGRMKVHRGPRENRARPSIDVLFRSAAVNHGPRTIGVILSGTLDDGCAGLEAVKRAGGKAIVQDPGDALFPHLPLNAMKAVETDHRLPIPELAENLESLVKEEVLASVPTLPNLQKEIEMLKNPDHRMGTVEELGELSPYKCPDCGGALWKMRDTQLLRFRCHLGHALSSRTLAEGAEANLEKALWEAYELCVEQARIFENLSEGARKGDDDLAEGFSIKARRSKVRASVLEKLIHGKDS